MAHRHTRHYNLQKNCMKCRSVVSPNNFGKTGKALMFYVNITHSTPNLDTVSLCKKKYIRYVVKGFILMLD